jgi:Protein of unknown function (DUF1592)/Protein of unknown function (DUF1588)/Protein of unknown function (DUF1587)/Protein of unknown function (DUF1585)/Protein of unknown function (DUF1595)/Planctomycete cytochrome C
LNSSLPTAASLALVLSAATARAAESYKDDIEPLLVEYCFDCHGDGSKKGDFRMDAFKDLNSHLGDTKHWIPVWRNLRSQVMPPSDEAQPSTEEKRKLLSWIESTVFKLDPKNPDPGRVTIRRLNRNEYRYAVQDLLGVEYDTDEAFPPDDTGYGFDNNGDVLSISPLLMEKYLTVAEEIVNLALPDDASAQLPRVDFPASDFKNPSVPPTWIPFSGAEEFVLKVPVKSDGKYRLTLQYSIQGATEATTEEAFLEIAADGKPLERTTLGWDQRRSIDLAATAKLTKGEGEIRLSLTPAKQPAAGEEVLYLSLQRLTLQGPLDGSQREYSKGHRMILVDGPPPEKDPAAATAYARKIMRSFVSRAFRRPIDERDITRLVAIVNEIDKLPGKTFQDGIKQAIATCLASPRFLFRVEIQPEPNNPAKIVPLDEYALASRLSFFLWSSVPDDELLSLAYNKKLRANLRPQVERMLKDPRSERLTENFVGQWLQARDVTTVAVSAPTILGVANNYEAAKAFDPRLRKDMQAETYALFDFILRNGRPVEELISARYSFLNKRLADFYGVKGVKGEELQPVDLTEHPERGGLLTQGSFLIVTSNPTRTSPVKRGLFVLDNLLGTPPPPPPPDVPELEAAGKSGENGKPTMREMMEIHRKNPDCRGCHARMDPIGLGLESFDALGRFRDRENGKPIDTAGVLITGETFQGIAALKDILADKRRQDLYRTVSEKLLTYAIGRGVEYYDSVTVGQLVDHLETHDGKLVELIHAITTSAPFQLRRGDE